MVSLVLPTRWATHGKPSERNAHPLCSQNSVAVVHNGIIENSSELKKTILKDYHFHSETDSEVIAHLFHCTYESSQCPLSALKQTIDQLKGSYAISLISIHHPNQLFFASHNSPLVIGLSDHEHFIASDHLALVNVSNKFIYLENHQYGWLQQDNIKIFNQQAQLIEPEIKTIDLHPKEIQSEHKGHFMLKEIHEQPEIIESQTNNFARKLPQDLFERIQKIDKIEIVACGTSYHAGIIAKYWLETYAPFDVHVEVASEYRYRSHNHSKHILFITLSQSGETADTIAALREVKRTAKHLTTLTITNSPHSTLTRESDYNMVTPAGPEIGVASANPSQLSNGTLLAHPPTVNTPSTRTLSIGPNPETNLRNRRRYQTALAIAQYKNLLFIGRHLNYPLPWKPL